MGKTFGGTEQDFGKSVYQTPDGGFIIGGVTCSTDGDVTMNHGLCDYWIIKTDSIGNLLWEKTYGGTDDDHLNFVIQSNNHNILIAGSTSSNNGDVTINYGGWDYWVLEIDSVGNLIWEKSLGNTGDDIVTSIQKTIDGGYIVKGTTSASIIRIYKLSTFTSIDDVYDHYILSLYPNPVTAELNIQFTLTENKNVDLQLYNSLGQIVKTIAEEKLPAGENKINFSTENLPGGVYYLQLKVDDEMVTRKVVKM